MSNPPEGWDPASKLWNWFESQGKQISLGTFSKHALREDLQEALDEAFAKLSAVVLDELPKDWEGDFTITLSPMVPPKKG